MSNENDQDQNDQRVQALYQSMPDDEPPAELDARILQAAHQAVKLDITRVVRLHRHKTKSMWIKPLSYAAVMLLTLGMVLHLQTEIPATIQSHPELFYLNEEAGDTVAVSPIKELQQAERAAPVKPAAPAAQMLQEKLAPAPELPKQAARSLASERIVEQKNKRAKANDEVQGMQPPGSMMMDAARFADAPAAATLRFEESDLKRKSALPDVDVDVDVDAAVTELLRLYRANETQQLVLQLRTFIAKYPQYELPNELQKFAKQNGLLKPAVEKTDAE